SRPRERHKRSRSWGVAAHPDVDGVFQRLDAAMHLLAGEQADVLPGRNRVHKLSLPPGTPAGARKPHGRLFKERLDLALIVGVKPVFINPPTGTYGPAR